MGTAAAVPISAEARMRQFAAAHCEKMVLVDAGLPLFTGGMTAVARLPGGRSVQR